MIHHRMPADLPFARQGRRVPAVAATSAIEGGAIRVAPVLTAADRRRFMRFPWSVYRGNSAWVPPLLSDFKKKLDTERNPFYLHAEIQPFLAYHNGAVVGTVAAIIDHEYNSFHDERTGFFGFFEAEDLVVVARALLDAAGAWLKARGMTHLRGPVNPSTSESMGTLLDAYDVPPAILMAYNPSYYPRLLEAAGLAKARDLVALYMDSRETPVPPQAARLAELVRRRHNVTIRSADLRHLDREMALLKLIYNDAWTRNWGFVPWSDEEIEYSAADLKMVIDPDLVFFAFVDGEPAGFSLALPDFHQVLRRINGRLFPTGVLKVLWYRRRMVDLRPARGHGRDPPPVPQPGPGCRVLLRDLYPRRRQGLLARRVLLGAGGQPGDAQHPGKDGRAGLQALPHLRTHAVARGRVSCSREPGPPCSARRVRRRTAPDPRLPRRAGARRPAAGR